ncbi:MAG: hypothetical protein KAH48_01605 [Chlorobi bacterium]|nr:hypothetical protein [Chlorobiota bacterium]
MKYIVLLVILIFTSCAPGVVSHKSLMDLNIGDNVRAVESKIGDRFVKTDFKLEGTEYRVIYFFVITSISTVQKNPGERKYVNVYNKYTGVNEYKPDPTESQTKKEAQSTSYFLILKEGVLIDWGFLYELKRKNNSEILAVMKKYMTVFTGYDSKEKS